MNIQDYYNEGLKWAVIGDVLNEKKYAYKILENFKNKGQKVVGVSPYSKSGEVYKSLEEIDYNIEGVNLCINPKVGYEILNNDNRHNIKCVIAQPGARSEDIKKLCESKNINYIEACTLVTL